MLISCKFVLIYIVTVIDILEQCRPNCYQPQYVHRPFCDFRATNWTFSALKTLAGTVQQRPSQNPLATLSGVSFGSWTLLTLQL